MSFRTSLPARRASKNWIGICSDKGVHVTEEDIAEARREMWGNFPREIE